MTILFTDIQDSTALNEELGDKKWLKILAAHDVMVQRCAARYGGMVIKSQGDGFMIAFAEAEEAVRAGIKIQRTLASNPRRLRKAPIAVRIGAHTGPALEKGGDLFGRNVALAARVTDLANGGEIVVTAAVSEAIGEDSGLVFVEHSEVELKGLPNTYELLSAEWERS
ncbi:MAG: adenylate/guanylate cyclase domain-containing protein [Solirubrobacterales bacterium]|nr:adenylate/guanylate cyclase domain-containing protein [Solirubrobacterales bacterium]